MCLDAFFVCAGCSWAVVCQDTKVAARMPRRRKRGHSAVRHGADGAPDRSKQARLREAGAASAATEPHEDVEAWGSSGTSSALDSFVYEDFHAKVGLRVPNIEVMRAAFRRPLPVTFRDAGFGISLPSPDAEGGEVEASAGKKSGKGRKRPRSSPSHTPGGAFTQLWHDWKALQPRLRHWDEDRHHSGAPLAARIPWVTPASSSPSSSSVGRGHGAWRLSLSPLELKRVLASSSSWSSSSGDEDPTRDLALWVKRATRLGAIVRQEEASMVPVALLAALESSPLTPGGGEGGGEAAKAAAAGGGGGAGTAAGGRGTDGGAAGAEERPITVLDVCASPGSKTSQIMALVGSRGLVIANDLDRQRAAVLWARLKKMGGEGLAAVLVTTHDATHLPLASETGRHGEAADGEEDSADGEEEKEEGLSGLRGLYGACDAVVCDVPCSGDGTVRKDMSRRYGWAPSLGLSLHRLQLRIACRAARCLRPGGVLAYSTCSLNPVEDEAVVAAILRCAGPALRLLDATSLARQVGLRACSGISAWHVLGDDLGPITSLEALDTLEAAEGAEEGGGAASTSSGRRLHPNAKPQPLTPREAKHLAATARKNGEARARASMWPVRGPEGSGVSGDAASPPLDRCVRVYPHIGDDTGGFFVALLQRTHDPWPSSRSSGDASEGSRGATEGRRRGSSRGRRHEGSGAFHPLPESVQQSLRRGLGMSKKRFQALAPHLATRSDTANSDHGHDARSEKGKGKSADPSDQDLGVRHVTFLSPRARDFAVGSKLRTLAGGVTIATCTASSDPCPSTKQQGGASSPGNSWRLTQEGACIMGRHLPSERQLRVTPETARAALAECSEVTPDLHLLPFQTLTRGDTTSASSMPPHGPCVLRLATDGLPNDSDILAFIASEMGQRRTTGAPVVSLTGEALEVLRMCLKEHFSSASASVATPAWSGP